MLTTELKLSIEQMAARYPSRRSALMPALHLVQRASGGWVSKEQLAEIADAIQIPRSVAFGVQSYYTMYNRQPVGRYHLQVDVNVPAMLAGADETVAALSKLLGIAPGETTGDGLFTLSRVQDLGACGSCPVIQVNDRYYTKVTPDRVGALIDSLRKGVMPDWDDTAAFGTECNLLLKHRGSTKHRDIAAYQADGGYKALAKALEMGRAAVAQEVKDAAVRGRGGAGFPMGTKWSFVPKDTGKPVYLICNADEGEPGTYKDRQIMEFDPHLLIEGMAIAGLAIGSALGFIYIRGEFDWIADILDAAIEQARRGKLLGASVLGSEFAFDIVVHRGAGAYVCGEETALIESLEGKRGQPRLKPPFPAAVGVYGCPTVVNNVESLALVPYVIEHGAAAFKEIGTPNNFGPRIFGISGHVKRPGTYEYPLGTPLETLLEAAGGVDGKLKAVIVGGLSVPILTAEEAKGLRMDYDSCQKAGTMLGSGGVIVMNDTTSIPKVALRAIEFYAHESCGQCTPCRNGSNAVRALLTRLAAGHGSREDIDTVLRLCQTIRGTTLCPTGEAFAMPIQAMVKKFRGEFEALVG
ncbi:MAG: NADH-quinone oxidoreductase subunit NuoF [Proteobacteria bacterium]|jgi:NADH-quinone oxidoreductase F subunit|nr:NADH-quinone oxidoreductase subunit NuoF [Pseudomonadota bacterium]